jgi:predicted acylesterase/phospholipase RssA
MSKLRIALALGSGGLRGIAHIGVLRALAEAEIQPTVYAGSSAGALVAAAAAYDLSLSEMERIAARLHRKSLFQIDVLGLLRYGTGALSLYRSAPLRELCVELFGDRTFYDLGTPLRRNQRSASYLLSKMKEHRFSLPFTRFGREHCISPMKPCGLKHYSLRGGTYEFKNCATHREWDRDCPSVRTVCARSFLSIRCG